MSSGQGVVFKILCYAVVTTMICASGFQRYCANFLNCVICSVFGFQRES